MEADLTSQIISTERSGRFAFGAGDHALDIRVAEAVIDCSVGGAQATKTATGLIPANAFVLGLTAEVVQKIAGSASLASFDIGESGDPNRWGSAIALAEGTTVTSANYTASPQPAFSTSAIDVTIDGNSTETLSSGKLRICVFYARTAVD